MSIDFLQERIRKLKNPTMVGLDPYLPILPKHIVQEAFDRDGQTLAGAAAAYYRFCTELLDALKDIVPAVKIQSACFEALGADGIAQMQRISAYAKDLGYYVLIDSMRGDVGNIAEIHAQAMFGTVPVGETAHQIYRCDALTVNGYLGTDGVEPFLKECRGREKSLFMLVKTSNPSSGELQNRDMEGKPLYARMAEMVAKWGEGLDTASCCRRVTSSCRATAHRAQPRRTSQTPSTTTASAQSSTPPAASCAHGKRPETTARTTRKLPAQKRSVCATTSLQQLNDL